VVDEGEIKKHCLLIKKEVFSSCLLLRDGGGVGFSCLTMSQ
jgi:hypothetical protein